MSITQNPTLSLPDDGFVDESSTSNNENVNEYRNKDEDRSENEETGPVVDKDDHPRGLRLAVIVSALLLSIFLVGRPAKVAKCID
jgi:hypothetical protein